MAEQFARIAAMAAALRLQPLARQDEAAYVFRP
ncbi:AtzG-like protein [Comamonas endophytica]